MPCQVHGLELGDGGAYGRGNIRRPAGEATAMPALTTQTDELSGNEQLLSLVVRVRRRARAERRRLVFRVPLGGQY